MPEIDEPNAVDVEVDPVVEGEGAEPAAVNPEAETLFLDVDGRTKFKTADDAKKSFHEAGKRIEQLSAYEKAVKRYGIADAQQIPGLLDELISLRKASEAAKAPKTEPKAGPEPTKEQKEIREFLTKELPGLGFITNAQLEKIQAELKELREGTTSGQEARVQSLIEEGQSTVSGYLSEAKIVDPSGKKALAIEKLIRADIEADPEMEARFWKGGREMKALLKERYDEAMETLGWTASVDATKPNAAAAHALTKGKQIVANKKLPPADSASKGAPEVKTRQNGGKRDYISELHDKARQVFEESLR